MPEYLLVESHLSFGIGHQEWKTIDHKFYSDDLEKLKRIKKQREKLCPTHLLSIKEKIFWEGQEVWRTIR